jgi:hypothetical protein
VRQLAGQVTIQQLRVQVQQLLQLAVVVAVHKELLRQLLAAVAVEVRPLVLQDLQVPVV